MEATTKTKYVYDFAEGSKEMRDLLGGKGANIAEMTRIGGPVRVPNGFTITTEACVSYMEGDGSSLAILTTLCSCPYAPARASRCRA